MMIGMVLLSNHFLICSVVLHVCAKKHVKDLMESAFEHLKWHWNEDNRAAESRDTIQLVKT